MSLIDKILTEWSYRVHDGMPNPKNPLHIVQLKESMEELSLSKAFIFEFIQNLFEEEQKQLSDKDKEFIKKKGLVWKGYANGYGKEGKENPVLYKNVNGKLVSVGDETGDKDTEGDQDQDSGPGMSMKSNQFDGKKGEGKETKVDINKLSADELRVLDHTTTDSQLNLTTVEAKAQAEKKGEKGVGAGTAKSRAGEASVHFAVRQLVDGQDIDDIKRHLLSIAGDSDKILDEKWANAAINTAQWIHDVYGDNIEEVVWDTPAGRKLIGTEGHGTSSDMFIKTKNGKRIGISLKQTTQVFLLNGGYDTQHEHLLESLREALEPEEFEEFEKLTSITNYETGFRKHLTTLNSEFETNNEFKESISKRIEEYKTMSDEEFVKIFDSLKYRNYLDDYEKIIKQLPHVSPQPKIKFICKVMKDPEIHKKFPQHYDNLRNEEVIATQAILSQASSNENVANGLKKVCLEGMHAEDILFGKSKKLDEFITLYGNNPAVELDIGVLLSVFELQDEYEQYLSIDDEEEKEQYKEQLLEEMNKRLVIDIKDGAKSGEVKIRHSETGQDFHLFGIKARAKALAAALSLEMYQTTFMGNVIKEGTAVVKEWKTSTKTRYVNARVKELLEEMEDSSTEQKQALKQEIKDLEAIE